MDLRRVGLLEKSQPTKGSVRATGSGTPVFQARPMMDAVAINSSSSASDTLPDTE